MYEERIRYARIQLSWKNSEVKISAFIEKCEAPLSHLSPDEENFGVCTAGPMVKTCNGSKVFRY